MNEKTLRALIDAGAVKRVRVIADGARFRVEIDTQNRTHWAQIGKAQVQTWHSLDTEPDGCVPWELRQHRLK